MTRTAQLLALAEAAYERGRATELHLGYTGDKAGKYIVTVKNEDIREFCLRQQQLVELVRLQNSIIEKYRGQVDVYGQTSCYEAIEAFNKWEGE